MNLAEEIMYRHYIKVDENGLILWGWSYGSNTIPPEDMICINENGTKDFRLFPDGEDNPLLRDADGIPLYEWDGEQVVAIPDEIIEDARAHVFRFDSNENRYVLNAEGFIVTNVIGSLFKNAVCEERYEPQFYTLKEGETTIPHEYAYQAHDRQNVGDTGFVKKRWTGSEWVEGATPEEIAAWEAKHPVPPPRAPTALEELQADTKIIKAQVQAQSDRADFVEDCIAEMAGQVYNV